MDIVVTDLTRFSHREKVCTAGVDLSTGTIVRPMPYLRFDRCRELELHPGAILRGKFTPVPDATPPHIEDMWHQDLVFIGPCSAEDFLCAMTTTESTGIQSGFGMQLASGSKCIPHDTPPPRSLITIRVNPHQFSIVEDNYKPGKIKAHVTDREDFVLRYVPITDLGYHDYAMAHLAEGESIQELNGFISSQPELYLRIGLSRRWNNSNGQDGYWIQINGIYTFPNYMEYVRCYA